MFIKIFTLLRTVLEFVVGFKYLYVCVYVYIYIYIYI